jgi:enoyl-CoA hydratase/carnithine racemase
LLTDRQGHVGILTFDHQARRNAITADMWHAIPEAIAEFAADDDVRVVVMRGAGDVAFVAGADISEFGHMRSGPEAEAYDASNTTAFAALSALQKPLIAMIHGFCIGGGVAIALTADMRYSADDGVFAIPAARLGLGYFMSGIETLSQVVGFASAKEIFFTADRFDASRALRMGLLTEVYPKVDLEEKVMERAERIARNAPLTLRAAKTAMQELMRPAHERDVQRVSEAISRCYGSEDYKEGVSAFLQKRSPTFSGC